MKTHSNDLSATQLKHNRIAFGLGTIGRDMVYAMVSMFLMFYLTDILKLSNNMILQITTVIFFARIFDALNDPIMGTVVDNTRTRWGKFKLWIILGALLSGVLTVLLFTDFGFTGVKFVVFFSVIYVAWGIAYTVNDIAYWSMLPSLSQSQKEREKLGSLARIFANIGLFTVVVGIDPITRAIATSLENSGIGADAALSKAYMLFALAIVIVLWIFQAITVFGVKEPKRTSTNSADKTSTNLRGMITAIFKNDQLLSVALSMTLFMTGYTTTTNFGLYFFKYVYGEQGMYSIFAAVLGVSQLLSLSLFSVLSKKWTRNQLYTAGTIGVAIGYILFFFSPMNMIPIGVAGLFIFFSQALIQLLTLVFLADTVEYGQWKLGKRNESITFSLQPFIYKLGAAIASGVTGIVVVASGMNTAISSADMTQDGLLLIKIAMFIFPLIMFVCSFIVYKTTFKIDTAFFNRILEDLKNRD